MIRYKFEFKLVNFLIEHLLTMKVAATKKI